MRRKGQGGTSIADEETNPLVWVGLLAAVALLVIFLWMRSSGSSDEGQAAAAESEDETTAPKAAAGDEELAPAAIDEPGDSPPGTPTARAEVVGELEGELQSQRLWATLEIDAADERRLVIKTAYCKEAGLTSAIQTFSSQLKGQGFAQVACYAQHGSLAFERGL